MGKLINLVILAINRLFNYKIIHFHPLEKTFQPPAYNEIYPTAPPNEQNTFPQNNPPYPQNPYPNLPQQQEWNQPVYPQQPLITQQPMMMPQQPLIPTRTSK